MKNKKHNPKNETRKTKNEKRKIPNPKTQLSNLRLHLILGTPNFYHTSMVTPDAKPKSQIPKFSPQPKIFAQNIPPNPKFPPNPKPKSLNQKRSEFNP